MPRPWTPFAVPSTRPEVIGSRMAKDWSKCGCPKGTKRLSTKGRGRGWTCQASNFKVNKKGKKYLPFVKAACR